MLVAVPSVHHTPPSFRVDSCIATFELHYSRQGWGTPPWHLGKQAQRSGFLDGAGEGVERKWAGLGMFTTPI